MASPADVSTGQVLGGRYEVGELLGRGGCAAVYAAHDTQLDRDVAVKVWDHPDQATAEGRLTARLHHPGVVVVHDASSDGDLAYLVMERVDGLSLDVELRLGPLPPDRAASVVGQLARTLSLVHGDGVVHGDVKPGNILLGPHDHVTLTDFGVASPSRTRFRDVAHGTPQYLSPEQARGLPLTPATDVYATGLVLLECLTGTRAFPGPPEAAAAARLHGGPRVPRSVPPDVAALVRDMTALDPLQRPAAGQVATRLESTTPHADTMLLAAGPPTQPVATEGKQWWLLVGGALVAVVVALAVTGPQVQANVSGVPDAPVVAASSAPKPAVTRAPVASPRAAAAAPVPVSHRKGKGHRKHH